jgi:hypothetical protein
MIRDIMGKLLGARIDGEFSMQANCPDFSGTEADTGLIACSRSQGRDGTDE